VFATDAALQLGASGAALVNRPFHQLAAPS
jgi:hypothetical protein